MIRWNRPDILAEDAARINFDKISRLRAERESGLKGKNWTALRELLENLSPHSRNCPLKIDTDSGVVKIGEGAILDSEEKEQIQQIVEALIPWRKGPFELFEIPIDAEWLSHLKWNRIAPQIGDIRGKRVADVGCNNGYYLMRLAEFDPRVVVGLDPSMRCWYQFELFQRYLKDPRLIYELLGIEHMELFPNYFDCVLCCGVLSHHRNPIDLLQVLKTGMAPGGTLIVENLAIEGQGSLALCVPDRYAKMRNVYFIPTADGICAWLEKAGFESIEVFSFVKSTPEEQRQTKLAPYQSLKDFLDPDDPNLTIEGFPAPYRIGVRATKKVGKSVSS